VKKLFLAGFAATAAMTVLMYVAPMMGMPKMDIATMLGTMFLASPGPAFWLGMMTHFMMGVVLFPAIYHFVFQPRSGSPTGRGVLFGLLLWAAANFVVMPMMGAIHPMVKNGMMPAPGFLMLNLGAMAPVGSLIGHLLYGVLLGRLAGPKASSFQFRAA
jgi:uncharacterized membrane protein YagU involved in acid resistance